MKRFVDKQEVTLVSLSEDWSNKFEPLLGKSLYISNPVHPRYHQNPDVERISGKILMVGRNDPVKGHSFAIDVIRRVREINSDVHLVLTGVSEHSEGWVKTLGWIPTDELVNQYQTTQILLMPSSFEGQPLAAIEAMSCGASVIVSSNVSSLPATVHSVPLDSDLWVEKIVELISSELQKEESGALSSFKIEAVQAHWDSIYSSICGANH
jgi:glycosyltransferase involved in cell wall biosynthesis